MNFKYILLSIFSMNLFAYAGTHPLENDIKTEYEAWKKKQSLNRDPIAFAEHLIERAETAKSTRDKLPVEKAPVLEVEDDYHILKHKAESILYELRLLDRNKEYDSLKEEMERLQQMVIAVITEGAGVGGLRDAEEGEEKRLFDLFPKTAPFFEEQTLRERFRNVHNVDVKMNIGVCGGLWEIVTAKEKKTAVIIENWIPFLALRGEYAPDDSVQRKLLNCTLAAYGRYLRYTAPEFKDWAVTIGKVYPWPKASFENHPRHIIPLVVSEGDQGGKNVSYFAMPWGVNSINNMLTAVNFYSPLMKTPGKDLELSTARCKKLKASMTSTSVVYVPTSSRITRKELKDGEIFAANGFFRTFASKHPSINLQVLHIPTARWAQQLLPSKKWDIEMNADMLLALLALEVGDDARHFVSVFFKGDLDNSSEETPRNFFAKTPFQAN